MLIGLFLISCNKVDKQEKVENVIKDFVVQEEVKSDFSLSVLEDGVKITWSVEPSNYPVTLISKYQPTEYYQTFNVIILNSNYNYELKGVFSFRGYEKVVIYPVKVIGKSNIDY